MGWVLEVIQFPPPQNPRNLLFHPNYHHFAYPTDFFAWGVEARYFPDDRTLPVYGTPYEVRGRLLRPQTAVDREVATFTAGQLAVSFRRNCAPIQP
jgi:hypothetical protein